MATTWNEDGSKKVTENKTRSLVSDYTIEDKKNVINFHKSGRKTPRPYELESLKRQYGHKV